MTPEGTTAVVGAEAQDFLAADFLAGAFFAVLEDEDDFLAVEAFFAGAFLAVDFDAVDFDAVDFDAVDFDAVDFAGEDFLAVEAFFAGAFLAVDFEAVDFDAVDFAGEDFLAVEAFFAGAFLAVDFEAVDFDAVDFEAVDFDVAFLAAAAVFAPADLAAPGVALSTAASVSLGSFLAPETTSLSWAPALKFGTAFFFAFIRAPVEGLRTQRASRTFFSKEPNPVIATFSPRATSRVMVSSTDSRA